MLRGAEDLVADLARITSSRHPARAPADRHLLRPEVEIPQVADVGVGQTPEQVTRVGALELDVGHLLGDRLDLDLQALARGVEMLEVGIERSDGPRVVVSELVDGAVADHGPVLVAEGTVPDLADRQTEHLVGEAPFDRLHSVATAKIPLAQRRFVPDPCVLPHRLMLCRRVAEVVGPEPTLPLHELAAGLALHAIESRANGLRAHRSLLRWVSEERGGCLPPR